MLSIVILLANLDTTDTKQRQIGLKNLENIDKLLHSFGLWPFIARLGMTRAQVSDLVERARAELRDPRMKAYIPL